jgi:streptogramin lyase
MRIHSITPPSSLFLSLCLSVSFGLAGCATGSLAPATPVQGAALQGKVYGGQQAVVGARVYLLAANTDGLNTTSAAYSSVSLLNASSTGQSDSLGAYVVTGAGGSFNISGDYSCIPANNGNPGQQVYLYATGGNSGGGSNSAISLMAILGDCPSSGNFATATPFVVINEVSTVAAAYAVAGFAYDATHISSYGGTQATTGLKNAFANAANIESLGTGVALATTPLGNGKAPQATLYTLANILAACINSADTVSGSTVTYSRSCSTLFGTATHNGLSTGTMPTDCVSAAINIAHNPGANVSTLYGLPATTPPFGSALTAQPNDFTLGIQYTGGSQNKPTAIAIDADGNAWIANNASDVVTELSPVGAASNFATGGTDSNTLTVAVDLKGNIWTGNIALLSTTATELSASGTVLNTITLPAGSTPNGLAVDNTNNVWVATGVLKATKLTASGSSFNQTSYAAGGIDAPSAIAIDSLGNMWLTDDGLTSGVTKLTSAGAAATGSPFTGSVLTPVAIAIDPNGNAWVANNPLLGGSSITELNNSGVAYSGSSFTGGGINAPSAIAIDGANNIWVANSGASSVTEFNDSGAVLSSNGYEGGSVKNGAGIAIDGSGNVWITDNSSNATTELLGAATPTETPIAAALPVPD